MNALEKLREISKALVVCGIDTAEKEAEILITQGLNIDPAGLYANNPEIDDSQMAAIDEMAARRCNREPLQYILRYNDFLGLKLLVGQGVLIPRPETELMAEYAIKRVRSYESGVIRQNSKLVTLNSVQNSQLRILDLCTGSGCLALSLAKEFPEAQVCGIDISEEALGYAKKNADMNGIENVEFLAGHLFDALGGEEMFDFILSNPPYIRTADIKSLQPEIMEWEPLNALDGGSDGLNFYREIVPAARKFLKDSGIIMFELGDDCAHDVEVMFDDAGYSEIEIKKDYSGIKRIIQAKWTK
jgi:release factor glutamine methyltransferase